MGLGEHVDAAIDAALVNRIVGCVVLVNQHGKQVYARAAGFADREANRPMEIDAIFRLASVTKPVITTAILRLVEHGVIRLDDPVTRFLPWFAPLNQDGSPGDIRIRHLLTHTSGLSYADLPPGLSAGSPGPLLSLNENVRSLAKVPLAFNPGTGWAYGTSFDVLGAVLAALNGSNVEDALSHHVSGPLGMTDTHFYVTDISRLAVPYADGRPPIRMNDPYTVEGSNTTFSPSQILNPATPQSGGGGMAGTAADVMTMLEAYNGRPGLLQPETVKQALANQIGTLPLRESDAGQRFSFIGALIDNTTSAWGGAWGHNWFVDPVNGITVVVCTNTTFEGCNGPFREDIRDAVYAGLTSK